MSALLATTAAVCAAATPAAWAAPDTPDASFGDPATPGQMPRDGFGGEGITDVLVLPDGKILEAGDGLSQTGDIHLQRRLANGAIDCTFGSRNAGDGRGVTNPMEDGISWKSVQVVRKPDGDLIMAGTVTSGGAVQFARVSASGVVEATLSLPGPGYPDGAKLTDLVVTPDGGVAVAARSITSTYGPQDAKVYKATAALTKDPDWGPDSVATIPAYYAADIAAIDGPGTNDVLVTAGFNRANGYDAFTPRLVALKVSDGTPAPYFEGDQSEYVFPNSPAFSMEQAVATGPAGAQKLNLAGVSRADNGASYGPAQAAFARFDSDGTPDESFGTGSGQAVLPEPLGGSHLFLHDLEATADGALRTVVNGTTVAGVTASGAPDTSIEDDGTRIINGPTGAGFALAPDGRWVTTSGQATGRFLGDFEGATPPANTEAPANLCTEAVTYTVPEFSISEAGGQTSPPVEFPREGTLIVNIERDDTNGPRMVPVKVDGLTATGGEDYEVTYGEGQVYFNPGNRVGSMWIELADDEIQEPAETLRITTEDDFEGSVNDSGTQTILDNDTPQAYTIEDASVEEGDAGPAGTSIGFTVTRTRTDAEASVPVSLEAGTATSPADFAGDTPLTAVFEAGSPTATVEVPVTGDDVEEPDETFTIRTDAGGDGTDGEATGTILDDDAPGPPAVSVRDAAVAEGGPGATTPLTFAVALSAPAAKDVTVAYATADGTAAAGNDYQAASGTVTIPAGQIERAVVVQVIGDSAVEGSETLTVSLSDPVNATPGTAIATGTIINDDAGGGGSVVTPGPDKPIPTPSPSPSPTPTPPPDTTGPPVVIPADNKSLTATATGVVPFALGRAAEDTSGILSLKTDGKVKAARAAAKKKVLALGSKAFQALKGQEIVVKVRLSKAGRKLLKKRKKLRLQATITLRDVAGNATVKSYKFTLKAPKRKKR